MRSHFNGLPNQFVGYSKPKVSAQLPNHAIEFGRSPLQPKTRKNSESSNNSKSHFLRDSSGAFLITEEEGGAILLGLDDGL